MNPLKQQKFEDKNVWIWKNNHQDKVLIENATLSKTLNYLSWLEVSKKTLKEWLIMSLSGGTSSKIECIQENAA